MDYSNLPISAEAEVVICGGGTAGAFAAKAAADMGRDVLVVEQLGSLGGTSTNGLVTPVMHTHIETDPQCSYIANIIRDELLEIGGCNETGTKFDPLLLKMVMESICAKAGVRFLYHTFIADVVKKDDAIDYIVVCNKGGLSKVKAKIFIDCTGDADVCVRAGAKYTKGNPDTGKNQPVSFRYIVDGVDIPAFGEFLVNEVKRTGVDSACGYYNGEIYAACCAANEWTLDDVFYRAIDAGDLTVQDKAYWQVFGIPGRKDSLAFNNPEFFEHTDATNPDDMSKIEVEGKAAILRQLKFYKKYFKGFENAYIAEISAIVGIRESRNVVTEQVLTAEDLLCRRKFDDMFCQSNYPVDIHGAVLNFDASLFKPVEDGKPWYEIPFGSLVVKGIDNLFVAGRCMGAEFLAQSSLRVQQSVRASGEAAGIGAALAVEKNILPRNVDGVGVRKIMVEKGAQFV